MSECCAPKAGDAPSHIEPGFCPGCGAKGSSVSTLTVKNLVRDHTRVAADGTYWFCRVRDCEVVYFSNETIFRERDVKVRVGVKEQEDPVPLCYCFDYTREDIRRDLAAGGETNIPDRIKAEIQAGFCACEVKNPSGTCCLGDVNRAVKELKQTTASGLEARNSFG